MARGNGGTFKNDDIAVERELPCKLTEDELRMRGDAMADAELLVDQLKDERRALNKKIFAQTDARNRLAHVIDAESEPRLVVCKWLADFEHNVYQLIRQDTGELVEQRPMSAADHQAELPYPADGGDGDAAGEGTFSDPGPGDTPDENADEDLPTHPDDDEPDPDATPAKRKSAKRRAPSPKTVKSPRKRKSARG